MNGIRNLIGYVRCYETVRFSRWPEGMRCPHCESLDVIKRCTDETEPAWQRYRCKACGRRIDDLTEIVFAGHHSPLRMWMPGLYFKGLNLCNQQITKELDLYKDDVGVMAEYP